MPKRNPSNKSNPPQKCGYCHRHTDSPCTTSDSTKHCSEYIQASKGSTGSLTSKLFGFFFGGPE